MNETSIVLCAQRRSSCETCEGLGGAAYPARDLGEGAGGVIRDFLLKVFWKLFESLLTAF